MSGWVGGQRLPLHMEQQLLSHIDCFAEDSTCFEEDVLPQERKASKWDVLFFKGLFLMHLHRAHPFLSQLTAEFFRVSRALMGKSLWMRALWMAG